jgi:hypothetical protein
MQDETITSGDSQEDKLTMVLEIVSENFLESVF